MLRVARLAQPLDGAWQRRPVAPRGATRLGISIRSPQLDAFGLEMHAALAELLALPFDVVRFGAYWNRIERVPGAFDTAVLDAQIEAAERANKHLVVCVGALKTFGYPEFFAPRHVVESLPEGTRIGPSSYPALQQAAMEFIARIIERYQASSHIIAWQVEHESVDPLGFEHSWRLDAAFVAAEVAAARRADPLRPILMNGFLPVTWLGWLTQWWQTRDQGDSLAVALRLADIVGVDFYPRVGLVRAGGLGAYLVGGPGRLSDILSAAQRRGKRVMVSEGQAEPWESVTVPPNPRRHAPFSCTPEDVIDNYNACMRVAARQQFRLDAYLFWGAEYWLVRQRAGDRSYLSAVARVLDAAHSSDPA